METEINCKVYGVPGLPPWNVIIIIKKIEKQPVSQG